MEKQICLHSFSLLVSISKNPLGLAPILTLCYAIATPLYK